jgi:anti-sigma regulatory factor (Ser/Thr protein kinase)
MTSPRPRQPGLPVVRVELPATLTAPRQARAAVRDALAAWGLTSISSDAELIASELTANAAEHGDGQPIGLVIRPHTAGGRRGVLCQVTDTSPARPQLSAARPDSERGRGLRIVQALATSSGITTSPAGKTAWFTLTPGTPGPALRHAEPELEAGT